MRHRDHSLGGPAALPVIEGYTVHRLIQPGGFSKVYEATQHQLERRVAIKVLDARIEDERQRLTFERECQVMGKLSDHQSIVTVFASALTSDRHPCIVMELCEGTYRADEPLDIAEVVDVGAKVADAVQAIHEAGVVHRDIKPHNIFVTKHGEPAIGDFGISSIENERTIPGGAGFSVDYASPEVFEQGGAGAPGDIYSLGATLYHLASGHVPFPHTGTPEEYLGATIHRIIATPPPSLHRSDAPPQLDRLLRRCMAKRPEDRPASAAVVANELRELQLHVGAPNRGDRIARARHSEEALTAAPMSVSAAPSPPRAPDAPTLARPGHAGPSEPPPPAPDEAVARSRQRRLVLGISVAALALIGVSLVIALIARDGDEDQATNVTTTTIEAGDFVVLVPPEELQVERTAPATFQLTWSSPQTDVTFQIHLVGTDENRIAETSPYDWVAAEDLASPCFEIRTVGDDGRRVSQSATGPVCAAG